MPIFIPAKTDLGPPAVDSTYVVQNYLDQPLLWAEIGANPATFTQSFTQATSTIVGNWTNIFTPPNSSSNPFTSSNSWINLTTGVIRIPVSGFWTIAYDLDVLPVTSNSAAATVQMQIFGGPRNGQIIGSVNCNTSMRLNGVGSANAFSSTIPAQHLAAHVDAIVMVFNNNDTQTWTASTGLIRVIKVSEWFGGVQ